MASLMDEHPEKLDEYLNLFIDIQLEIHSKRVPLLNRIKDKFKRKLESATNIDEHIRYDLMQRLDGMEQHYKLCHGDFNPSNIIMKENGQYSIIDWAHATQGNASADVARSYLKFCLNGEEELAEKYLKLFCKKSDTAKQYVQRWLPIVAASQSVKGHEEERSLLLKWVDVVDYE